MIAKGYRLIVVDQVQEGGYELEVPPGEYPQLRRRLIVDLIARTPEEWRRAYAAYRMPAPDRKRVPVSVSAAYRFSEAAEAARRE